MLSNSHKKRNNQPYRYLLVRTGAFLLILALVALIVADVKIYRKKKEFSAQLASLQKKVQDLKNQNETLRENTTRADDRAYIEKVAREELDLQIPGEKVISFVGSKDSEPKEEPARESNLTGWVAGAFNWVVNIFKK